MTNLYNSKTCSAESLLQGENEKVTTNILHNKKKHWKSHIAALWNVYHSSDYYNNTGKPTYDETSLTRLW